MKRKECPIEQVAEFMRRMSKTLYFLLGAALSRETRVLCDRLGDRHVDNGSPCEIPRR